MKKNGRCPAGQYYCYTDEKCKPIPRGFKVVGRAGFLRKENGHTQDDDSATKKNGKKNGNVSNSNGNGNGGNGGMGGNGGSNGAVSEDLRAWFGKGGGGGAGGGGWDRYNTKGERVGKCAREDKDGDGKGDGPKPKCLSKDKAASMSKKERGAAVRRKRANDPNPDRKGSAIMVNTKKKTQKEETILEKEGKKDACYHKVKASASVWPSAYASGRLVQCRKVGAKNYGKSKKNEEFLALPEFSQIQIDAMRKAGFEVEVVTEKNAKLLGQVVEEKKKSCAHNMKGMYCPVHGMKDCPDVAKEMKCEAVTEAVRVPAKTGNVYLVTFTLRGRYMIMRIFFPEVGAPSRAEVQAALDKVYPGCHLKKYDKTDYQPGEPLIQMGEDNDLEEKKEHPIQNYVPKNVKGIAKELDKAVEMHKSQAKRLRKSGVSEEVTDTKKYEEADIKEGAAWTKSSGKNPKGGLNEKGRKSYERENPGSDLKRPSKKVGNKRRASFCARMKGMKKKLTSKKTASDPDSRINKSLRAWNC